MSQSNPMKQLLKKDQKMSKVRQRQLFYDKLQISEPKQMNQHIIRLNHFLESQREEVFQQLLKSIVQQYPDEEVTDLMKKYLQVQNQIDQSKYVMIELNKQVDEQKRKLLQQIQMVNKKLHELKLQRDKNIDSFQILKSEVVQYENFVKENQNHLKTKDKRIKILSQNVENLNKNFNSLLKKTQDKLKDVYQSYNQLLSYKESMKKKKRQESELDQQLSRLQIQLQALSPVTIKSEIELEELIQKIKVQKQQMRKMEQQIKRNTDRQNSRIRRQRQSNTPSSSHISMPNNEGMQNYTLAKQKFYFNFRKQKEQCNWIWWVFLGITVGLTIITLIKIF